MVIKTELCQYTKYQIRTQISRVHSPVVKAADCRSAGPWFNSGWWTLFTFVTWYDKLTNHDFLMINIMSPITTSNRTITRKSVNMVAELDNGTVLWTLRGIGQRLECNSVVTKVLHAIALKTPSRIEDYAVRGGLEVPQLIQWPGVPMRGELAGGTLHSVWVRVKSQEQLHEDQLITDTADLKMTEDALAEDTAKTQRKIAWKPKQKSRVSRPTTGVCLRN